MKLFFYCWHSVSLRPVLMRTRANYIARRRHIEIAQSWRECESDLITNDEQGKKNQTQNNNCVVNRQTVNGAVRCIIYTASCTFHDRPTMMSFRLIRLWKSIVHYPSCKLNACSRSHILQRNRGDSVREWELQLFLVRVIVCTLELHPLTSKPHWSRQNIDMHVRSPQHGSVRSFASLLNMNTNRIYQIRCISCYTCLSSHWLPAP